MDRFHVIVFNYERIESFINNFDKICNFNPLKDKILILDCSSNLQSQIEKLRIFAKSANLKMGNQVQFIRRKNWGIDQGGRIDYIKALHDKKIDTAEFIWQFQEHYLDLTSEWSIWSERTYNIDGRYLGGQLKADTIPDNVIIDLDFCEKVYRTHPKVSMIYAARLNIGIFPWQDPPWFYVDGVNFSVRTSYLLSLFIKEILDTYTCIFDGTYQWSLFMEFDICRRLTAGGGAWYDLVSQRICTAPSSLQELESDLGLVMHQVAEKAYDSLYKKYQDKYIYVENQSQVSRQLIKFKNHSSIFPRKAYMLLKNLLRKAINIFRLKPTKEYASFQEALQDTDTYEDSDLCKVVCEKTKYFIKSLAENKPYKFSDRQGIQDLFIILYVFQNLKRPIQVLEFGGACGATFYKAVYFNPEAINSWSILETPKMVEKGKNNFSHEKLRFFDSYDDFIEQDILSKDLIFASGVLQYMDDPLKSLENFLFSRYEYVYLTRTAVCPTKLDAPVITSQVNNLFAHGPGNLPPTSQLNDRIVTQPITIISESDLKSIISKSNYKPILYFDEENTFNLGTNRRKLPVKQIGMLLQLIQ